MVATSRKTAPLTSVCRKVRSGAGTFRAHAVLERARAASAGVADSDTARAARDRPATADAGLGCGCLCDHLHVPSAKELTHVRTRLYHSGLTDTCNSRCANRDQVELRARRRRRSHRLNTGP